MTNTRCRRCCTVVRIGPGHQTAMRTTMDDGGGEVSSQGQGVVDGVALDTLALGAAVAIVRHHRGAPQSAAVKTDDGAQDQTRAE
jgi:hypothetical protein